MSSLPPYPAYKNTPFPWLKQVPEHWGEMKVKYIFRERVQKGYPNEPLLAATQSMGVVTKEAYGERTVTAQKDLHLLKLVEKGDFVISLRSFQGGIEIAHARGIISPAYTILRMVRDGHPLYLAYLLKSAPFIDGLKLFITGIREGQNIDYARLARTYLPWPEPAEQQLIVRYLRAVDAKVKRYIRSKRKLIAALQEQKQAIIQQAVTRGLNPNVKLKPSGVEWLGEVPEHWEVVQIRRIASYVTSGSRGWAAHYSDSGDIFLQSGNLGRSMELNMSYTQYVKPPSGSEGIRTRVQRDDVLVCITGALTGNVAIVERDFSVPAYVNQHVALLRLRPSLVYPRFLTFVLHSELGRVQFKTSENGGTKQGLGLDDVKAAAVPLPPLDEQISICKRTDQESTQFTSAISRAEAEIKIMTEYHTRLIADVVTGAVDVREAAKALPEEELIRRTEDQKIRRSDDRGIGGPEDALLEEEELGLAAEGAAEYGEEDA